MTFQLLKLLGGLGSRKAFLINLMARWLLSSLLDWLIGRSRETTLAKEISKNETGPALLVQPELCRPRLYVVRGQRALQCDLSNAKSMKEWAMWSCKCIHMYTNTQLVQADMIAEHPSVSLTGKLCSVPISVLNVPVVPVVLVVLLVLLVVVLVMKTTTTSWSLHPCMYSILFKSTCANATKVKKP